MSRTNRSHAYEWHSGAIRYPQTFNEIHQIEEILHDDDLEDYSISGLNRLKKRKQIPTSWDDQVISAYYQEDHE
jgi:hypothetical protein